MIGPRPVQSNMGRVCEHVRIYGRRQQPKAEATPQSSSDIKTKPVTVPVPRVVRRTPVGEIFVVA